VNEPDLLQTSTSDQAQAPSPGGASAASLVSSPHKKASNERSDITGIDMDVDGPLISRELMLSLHR